MQSIGAVQARPDNAAAVNEVPLSGLGIGTGRQIDVLLDSPAALATPAEYGAPATTPTNPSPAVSIAAILRIATNNKAIGRILD